MEYLHKGQWREALIFLWWCLNRLSSFWRFESPWRSCEVIIILYQLIYACLWMRVCGNVVHARITILLYLTQMIGHYCTCCIFIPLCNQWFVNLSAFLSDNYCLTMDCCLKYIYASATIVLITQLDFFHEDFTNKELALWQQYSLIVWNEWHWVI